MTLEQFESFVPIPGLMREIGEMMLFEDEFGYAGGEEVVLPENVSFHDLLNCGTLANGFMKLGVPCQMTSWVEYVKKEDWSKILAPLK